MSAKLPTALPDRYLFAFEGDGGIWLEMHRQAYRDSIFLDARIVPASETSTIVPLANMPAPSPALPCGWIFHIAHCGSTLLARALDRPSGGVVLREPFTLRQLGIEAATSRGGDWQQRLQLATALLGRRYDQAQMSIVKANVPVNFIIPDVLEVALGAPAIFLHHGLADYLGAILRSPNHRNWLRGITTDLALAITAHAGAVPDDDAGRAAALWLAQLRCQMTALTTIPGGRSLDAETLFRMPDAVLAAAGELFGQRASDAEIASITSGALFATYSKNPAFAFDNVARLARQNALSVTLYPEISRARAWVADRLADFPLPSRLPHPLVADPLARDLLD
ncbi:MAG: hypothetical protein ACOYLS_05340 [Polymorphobacter sp.]